MDESQAFIKESSNDRPGEPLRPWTAEVPATLDLALTIKGAHAEEPVIRLLEGGEITKDDLIAFGRLNSYCVLNWYEPLVGLIGPRAPEIAPVHADLIRNHTKLFRGR